MRIACCFGWESIKALTLRGGERYAWRSTVGHPANARRALTGATSTQFWIRRQAKSRSLSQTTEEAQCWRLNNEFECPGFAEAYAASGCVTSRRERRGGGLSAGAR